MDLSKVINRCKNLLKLRLIIDPLGQQIIRKDFRKGDSFRLLSLFLWFLIGLIFASGCATRGGSNERAKARRLQVSPALDGYVYDESRLLGIVEQWEATNSLVYFESFRSIQIDPSELVIEVLRPENETFITVAQGELTGELSQHFAVAKLNVLKGKPQKGDQVWGLPVRETSNSEAR